MSTRQKSLNLKGKISILSIITFVLIGASIVFNIYYFTAGLIREQIDIQINAFTGAQKDILNVVIDGIRGQFSPFEEDDMISAYVNMALNSHQELQNAIENNLSENAIKTLKEDFSTILVGSGSFSFTTGKKLYDILNTIEYTRYAYITLPDGTVIADSRVKGLADRKIIRDYVGIKLDEELYKNIKFGTIKYDGEQPLLMVSKPLYSDLENEKIIGYIVVAITPDLLNGKFSTSLGDLGQATLINNQGIILSHENKELLGSKIENEWFLEGLQGNKNTVKEIQDNNYYILDRIGNENIYLAATIPERNIYAPAASVRNRLLSIAFLGLVVMVFLIYLLVYFQLKPLSNFVMAFNLLKEGKLKNEILISNKLKRKKDEIGNLAEAFNAMVVQLRDLILGIKEASYTVSSSIFSINESLDEVGKIAEQVGSLSEEVASGAGQQFNLIEDIKNNIKNLNSQIASINEASSRAADGADNVMESIENGNNAVKNSIKQIQNVKEDSSKISVIVNNLGITTGKIGEIVQLINNIAEQTNLLALNAAIEAARAGEAGRGFSVVAEEIRELAEESSTATDKISSLIKEIQGSVNQAIEQISTNERTVDSSVEAIQKTGYVFKNIEEVALELGRDIKQISLNSDKMAVDSNQVEEAIINISEVSDKFASNSEEIAASSEEQIASNEEIISSASKLNELAERLNMLIDNFDI